MRSFFFRTLILSATLHSALGEPSTLKDSEFVIEKERRLPLPEANRLFENAPTPPRAAAPALPVTYHFCDIASEWGLLPRKTKILRAQQDVVKRLYSNYVQGGYGNFYTPYLDCFFDNECDGRYAYGLRCRHFSAGRGGYAEESHNTLEAHGKLFLESLWLGGRLHYDRSGYPLYQPPSVTKVASHYVIHQLRVSPVLARRRQGPLSYRLEGVFDYLRDSQRVQEGQLGLLGGGEYVLNDLVTLKTGAAMHWSVHQQSVAVYRHLYRLKPVVALSLNKFNLQGGVNFVYQNDVCDAVRAFNVYPVLEAHYSLRSWLRPYVGMGGDTQRSSRKGFVEESPWLASDVTLLHTQQRVSFYGGARGNVSEGLAFHSGVSLGLYQNLPSLVNHKENPSLFDIQYVPEATLLNLFGEVTHTSAAETWVSRLRGDYFGYTHRPWHRPKYQFDLTSAYRFQDKLVLRGSVCWVGGVSAWDVRNKVAHGLADVVDVGLGVDYWWSSRLFIFFNCQNLLGRENERYWHYPSRGAHFLLGVAYAW